MLADRSMPGARWFTGAELNYAEHALARRDGEPAVLFRSEGRPPEQISRAELYERVSAFAAGLRRLGVGRGDRVAAYAPNIPETLVAFLATASLGAVWSSCSPDFGVAAVVDRFHQIEPKVLVAADGYRFKGRAFDRMPEVAALERALPSLEAVVVVANLAVAPTLNGLSKGVTYETMAGPDSGDTGPVVFEPVPFDHPLWVLYSSGTTGVPKAIVHGHGGILLEHLKALSLQMGLAPGDRFFWFTSTGWMMWNLLAGGLLVGATVVLYDGSPAHPDLGFLWRMAAQDSVSYFGTSASFLQACIKAGLEPGRHADLSELRAVGSTGAPLPADAFGWVYRHVKPDIALGSDSGGTDICSAFVGSCPILPVYAGEIQCRCLGVAAQAFDDTGRPVVGRTGELVVTQPMPSMPVGLWGDDGGRRYRETYFEHFPGVWRHGDWVKFTERGTCVIYGRSDATLNRGGVRIGTSEIYRVVESAPEVVDSLVVDTGGLGRAGEIHLFVVMAPGVRLDGDIESALRSRLRTQLSPRHVPDAVTAVPEIPRTLNGKKLEVLVKRVMSGEPWDAAGDAIANPEAMEAFADAAKARRSPGGAFGERAPVAGVRSSEPTGGPAGEP